MLREEALNKAIGVLTYHQVNFCKSKEAVANMNEIIEALEKIDQEQCGDCISREAVENVIKYAEINFTVNSDIDFTKHKREVQEIVNGIVDAQIKALRDLPSVMPQQKMGKCKDCKYFEYDSVIKVNGLPLHEICSRWGDGCKTSEDGYCFLFEPKTQEVKE